METRGSAFIRTLPSAAVKPVLIIPDDVAKEDREDLLNAMADEGASDPIVRRTALWIATRGALGAGRHLSDQELAQALLDGLHEFVEYTDDPTAYEEYNRAVTSLSPAQGMPVSTTTGRAKGRGDCEDMAVLFAALARSVGLRAQVVWLDQPGQSSNHVAAATCEASGVCHWVETTLPGARVGEHPYAAAERLGIVRTLGVTPR